MIEPKAMAQAKVMIKIAAYINDGGIDGPDCASPDKVCRPPAEATATSNGNSSPLPNQLDCSASSANSTLAT